LDVHLQQLAGAIRSTQHRQTGFTPNQMMLGREVIQPLDLFLGTARFNVSSVEPHDYVENLRDILQSVHQIARKNLQGTQLRQKRDYDLRMKQHSYDVEDVVLKIDSATKIGQSSKLKSPWKGPYIVSEVKSPVLYKIADRKGDCVIHHDRLKKCNDREFPVWVKKLRSRIMESDESTLPGNSEDQTEDFGMVGLFNSSSLEGESDSLTPHQRDGEDRVTITELQVIRSVAPSLDLDQTFLYQIEPDEHSSTSPQEQSTSTRRQKKLPHFSDFILYNS